MGKVKRHLWTADEETRLRDLYPEHSAAECAELLGVAVTQVQNKVAELGLRKSRDWIAQRARHNARPNSGQFRAGEAPWNKGTHYKAGGRSAETRFKPGTLGGRAAKLWIPIGGNRISQDGYPQRKVSETHYPPRDYVPIHHLVWRMHGNEIPRGHALIFRDGNKHNPDINNLELVSRAELMRRNSIHRLPPEIAKTARAIGTLRRHLTITARKEGNAP